MTLATQWLIDQYKRLWAEKKEAKDVEHLITDKPQRVYEEALKYILYPAIATYLRLTIGLKTEPRIEEASLYRYSGGLMIKRIFDGKNILYVGGRFSNGLSIGIAVCEKRHDSVPFEIEQINARIEHVRQYGLVTDIIDTVTLRNIEVIAQGQVDVETILGILYWVYDA